MANKSISRYNSQAERRCWRLSVEGRRELRMWTVTQRLSDDVTRLSGRVKGGVQRSRRPQGRMNRPRNVCLQRLLSACEIPLNSQPAEKGMAKTARSIVQTTDNALFLSLYFIYGITSPFFGICSIFSAKLYIFWKLDNTIQVKRNRFL